MMECTLAVGAFVYWLGVVKVEREMFDLPRFGRWDGSISSLLLPPPPSFSKLAQPQPSPRAQHTQIRENDPAVSRMSISEVQKETVFHPTIANNQPGLPTWVFIILMMLTALILVLSYHLYHLRFQIRTKTAGTLTRKWQIKRLEQDNQSLRSQLATLKDQLRAFNSNAVSPNSSPEGVKTDSSAANPQTVLPDSEQKAIQADAPAAFVNPDTLPTLNREAIQTSAPATGANTVLSASGDVFNNQLPIDDFGFLTCGPEVHAGITPVHSVNAASEFEMVDSEFGADTANTSMINNRSSGINREAVLTGDPAAFDDVLSSDNSTIKIAVVHTGDREDLQPNPPAAVEGIWGPDDFSTIDLVISDTGVAPSTAEDVTMSGALMSDEEANEWAAERLQMEEYGILFDIEDIEGENGESEPISEERGRHGNGESLSDISTFEIPIENIADTTIPDVNHPHIKGVDADGSQENNDVRSPAATPASPNLPDTVRMPKIFSSPLPRLTDRPASATEQPEDRPATTDKGKSPEVNPRQKEFAGSVDIKLPTPKIETSPSSTPNRPEAKVASHVSFYDRLVNDVQASPSPPSRLTPRESYAHTFDTHAQADEDVPQDDDASDGVDKEAEEQDAPEEGTGKKKRRRKRRPRARRENQGRYLNDTDAVEAENQPAPSNT